MNQVSSREASHKTRGLDHGTVRMSDGRMSPTALHALYHVLWMSLTHRRTKGTRGSTNP